MVQPVYTVVYYIVAFVILLGVLIFVHEAGHFLIAKLVGVKVLKFSLGFPPAMVKRKWGETEYILSWIPLGGYVKLLGEDAESDEEVPPEELPRAFTSKPLWARMAVIVAGPLSNYVLAVVLLCIAYTAGLPVLTSSIGEVVKGSPAMEAGIQPSDQIVAIDGSRIWRWDDMRRMVERSAGEPLKVTVERQGKEVNLTVTPKLAKHRSLLGNEVGRIGVTPSGKTVQLQFPASIYEGVRFSGELTRMIGTTLVNLVSGKLSTKSLSGPIMIAQAAGETLKSGATIMAGLRHYMVLMAFISINLAIINLLPVPILDGGHLMFFVIEAFIRRPVTGKVKEVAVQLGLLFIVFLMCLVFYNDISRVITKGWGIGP